MNKTTRQGILAFASLALGTAAAQAQTMPAAPAAAPAQPTQATAPAPAAAAGGCELHVWPSSNYHGMKTGLLVGFGAIGGLIEHERNKGAVKSINGQMAENLDASAQVAALQSLDLAAMLGKPGLRVVVASGEFTPGQMRTIKKRADRLTRSTAPCYAELMVGQIFYQKAALYGSNLFTTFSFRDFSGGGKPKLITAAVKNPLEDFPAKTPDKAEAARAELRDAFGKGFSEYMSKKVLVR